MLFFFYGTLMDDDVFARVVGRAVSNVAREPATLNGYARVYAKNALFPILLPAAGETIDGILVTGLNDRDRARIFQFEDDGYIAREVTVTGTRRGDVAAWVFMTGPGLQPTARTWRPADWRRRHKRLYLKRIWG